MPDWRQAVRDRLSALKLEGARESEIVDELSQYLEDCFDGLRATGIPEPEARSRALAELSDTTLLVRQLRRAPRPMLPDPPRYRGGLFMSTLLYDLRTGWRSLRTRPGFSLMVIGMLALGIAANAAIFSIFDGFFLRPLPFAEPARLVDVNEKAPQWNLETVGISNADFNGWRRDNSTFERMAFFTQADVNLSGRETAQRIHAAQVTRDLLDVLGLQPVLGRNFLPEEDKPGGAKVILLGYGLWQRLFNGDRDVLGKTLQLSGRDYSIVGVLPPEALFPDPAELWAPLAADPNKNSGWYLQGIGRLKRGVTKEQALADLERVHKNLPGQGGNHTSVTSPTLQPLRDRYFGDIKSLARVLLEAVGVVLLIACVNVAALMMVRGSARGREIAIRTAIGASRVRIVQQLLTENLLLAACGGAAGVLLGRLALRGLIALMPADMPRFIRFDFDARFALFCIAVTGAATLLFGLVPALQTSGVGANDALREAAPRTSLSRRRRLVLNVLVVGEIALALMLLVGAGLLVKAFRNVLRIDPGFRPENVLTYGVALPGSRYKPEQATAFFAQLAERSRALPGVKAVGAASAPPLGGHWGDFFEGEGGPPRVPGEKEPVVLKVFATPGYFEAIGMTLLAGRLFTDRDGQNADAPEILINESLVRQLWPGLATGQALGKGVKNHGAKEWMRVVGVIRDDRHYGLEQPPRGTVFFPHRSAGLGNMTVILRAWAEPESLVAPSREILRQANPDLPMFEVRTMMDRMNRSLWVRRGYSWLFGLFAAVALVLAAAGVYGVVSYAVNQRTREIGIRMALGAQPGQVLRSILGGGMLLVAVGAAAGLAAALTTAHLIEKLLFGVKAKDPAIYVAVVLGIAAVGLLANWIPARRAAAVDPMRALRTE